MTSPPSERLAALEQRLGDHEARCEERLAEIKATAGSTLRAVEALKGRAGGLMAALLAWALAQLWSANAVRMDRLETPRAAVVRTTLDAASRG